MWGIRVDGAQVLLLLLAHVPRQHGECVMFKRCHYVGRPVVLATGIVSRWDDSVKEEVESGSGDGAQDADVWLMPDGWTLTGEVLRWDAGESLAVPEGKKIRQVQELMRAPNFVCVVFSRGSKSSFESW